MDRINEMWSIYNGIKSVPFLSKLTFKKLHLKISGKKNNLKQVSKL